MPKKRFEEYRNGTIVNVTEIDISDEEAERDATATDLARSIKRLRTIAQRNQALADAGSGPNNAQMRVLAGDLADVAQLLRKVIKRDYDEES